jgi:hypothetical protein
VTQDLNDEHAAALLAQIKAEKAGIDAFRK